MIEIFNLIYCLLIFSLIVMSPIYPFNQVQNAESKSINLMTLNLIINLNLLLFLSFFNLKIFYVSKIFVLVLLLILIINSYKNYKCIKVNYSLFFIFIIIAFEIASKLELGWDAKWFWLIKTIYFFDDYFFSDLINYEYNKFHPHFGSYIWAFFWKLSYVDLEYTGRLFYLFLYLYSLYLITCSLNNNFFTKIFIFTLFVIITYQYKIFSGLQEIIIFSILSILSVLISDYIKNKKFNELIKILLLSNILLWIKSEGIAYYVILFISLNFINSISFKSKVYINLLATLMIILKIIIYKFFQININEQPYTIEYLSSLDFGILYYKIKNITLYLGFYSLKNLIYFLAGFFLILKIKLIFKDDYFRFILIFFIGNTAFIFLAYILRDMEVVYSLKTTIDRLIFSSSGIYLLFISGILFSFFKKYLKPNLN